MILIHNKAISLKIVIFLLKVDCGQRYCQSLIVNKYGIWQIMQNSSYFPLKLMGQLA